MKLGAQTHFGQGWNASLLGAVDRLGLDTIRDSVPWAAIETTNGKYAYSIPQVAWLDQALAQGVGVTLTFAHTNPLYDGGNTVYTDSGRAAFAAFVVETLKRYPNVDAIEIGNEYNSNSFVTGPIAKASAALRDDYYADLISAVYSALDRAGLDVDLVGGATHSIPVDYFADLKALGTLDKLDAISIHPYTTPPEQFAQQIEVLRGVIGDEMGIRVTEFGDSFASLADAPAYVAKMVSVMAAAGIESASWYALARQAWYPNMELWDQSSGRETPAGLAFRAIEDLLDGAAEVERIETDDFTYLYTFGDHAAVLWGTTGKVTLAAGVEAWDLAGNRIADFNGEISSDTPIILKSSKTIDASSVTMGGSTLVGDSFTQFDVTNDAGGTDGFDGPWSYFAEASSGKLTPLYTMGGGLKGGEPWTPYLGTSWLRPLEVNATTITPVDFAAGANASARYSIVERFTAQTAAAYKLQGSYNVADSTQDGIVLTIRVDGKKVFEQRIYDKASGHEFSFQLEKIMLNAGSVVDFVTSSGANAKGDVTSRHIQIHMDDAAVVGRLADRSTATDYSQAAGSVSADLAAGTIKVSKLAATLSADGLIGSGHADKIYGNERSNYLDGGNGNDRLFGRDGGDHLIGGAGNDRLDGGRGADRMEGGAGNDTYFVDDAADRAFEVDAKGGVDTVWSSVSFGLGDNIERLYLTGGGDIDAHGNSIANIIKGNTGDNVLNGGAGRDKLEGGAGADTFWFDILDAADVVMDFRSGVDGIALSRAAFAALGSLEPGQLDHLSYGRSAAGPGDHLFYDGKGGVLYYDADGSGSGAAVAIVTFSNHSLITADDIILI